MPLLLLLLLLVSAPLLELYVLIEVGGAIGALPTIALCILTALIGALLLRQQGLNTLGRVQAALDRGELPAIEVLEGLILVATGAMLLTPGFITDVLGFVCLLPGPRRMFAAALARRMLVGRPPPGGGPRGGQRGDAPRVIEGDYRRLDDD